VVMIVVPVCGRSVLIDNENMEICFGFECIRYGTREQFDAAYKVVMIIAKVYEEIIKKAQEELKRAGKGGS